MRIAMSASMNWIAWCSAMGFANWTRSFAYLTDSSKAPWAMPTAIAPMPILPPSRIFSAFGNPSFSFPSNAVDGTWQSVRITCDVGLPRTPSLSSTRPIESPGFPRSTMNALIPRFPFVASVIAWITKVPATGAFVHRFFVPLRTQPSFDRFAVVSIAEASEPLFGSVSAQAPSLRPLARSGTYLRRWSSFPAIQTVPVHRELWAAMMSAWDPQTRATSSTVIARAIESRPAPSYSSGIVIPRNPRPAIFAIVAFGNSPVLSTCAATGRISFSAKSRAVRRIISCSGESSKSIAVPGVKGADGLLGLRFARANRPSAAVSEVADYRAALLQEVHRRVALAGHVIDDLVEEAFPIHLRNAGAALLVGEVVEARAGEGPSVQHHEDRRQIEVRFREPVVLQFRHVPVDEFPFRRALDEECQVEPKSVPDGHEVPRRLQDPLGEDRLDHLFLSPFPLGDDLEQPGRSQVLREALVLDRNDSVLLRIVSRRLDVEVVERQSEPVPEPDETARRTLSPSAATVF